MTLIVMCLILAVSLVGIGSVLTHRLRVTEILP